ncbi:subclass B3 metallo-beta-lactamase [Erythrobacter sp. HKB08]|uniref:subclass B3 metallo-beta-lactamase n=1 Tax=Erythrobacter sp. HKB08 TaxID=2502843 RepID=UPI0018F8B724|nr:subclass B3 metallo-beta-lactamase [Erythrobacter sp. HKB08]
MASAQPVDEAREAWLAACEDWDDWNKPAPPFRIYGNSWYVGTCGIAAILIVGPTTHVLIDTGTEEGAEVVRANIEQLGYDMKDVTVLLQSHEHFDHVGGLAKMKEWTGGAVVASKRALLVLETGMSDPADPQHGMHAPMTPVPALRGLTDGDTVLGAGKQFNAIETPGHTPGALSWRWLDCEGIVCAWIVYADSLSPVSADEYRFSDHPEYVEEYRAGLARLAETECSILVTPHPSASRMLHRMRGDEPWLDPKGCANYAEAVGKRLDERLARERGE